MEDLVLGCTGAVFDSLWLPAFQLRRGEFLCLHMPGIANDGVNQQLAAGLTGANPVDGLEAMGHVQWVEMPKLPKGILSLLFKHPLARDWLAKKGRISRQVADEVVGRVDRILGEQIGKHRIGSVPWEGKMLLALEAAWLRGADAIVFTATGGAGLPEKKLFDAIRPRLPSCAAIQLKYEYSQNGLMKRTCFSGARCLEVTRRQAKQPYQQAS